MSKWPELPEKRLIEAVFPEGMGRSLLLQPRDGWGARETDQGEIQRKVNGNEIQAGKIKRILVTREKEWAEIPVLSPISCKNFSDLLKLL